MCLDISFKIETTEDSLYDYLPDLKVDPQLDLNLEPFNGHLQAHNRPKTRIIFRNQDASPYLTYMRWGVLQRYMFKDISSFQMFANNSYNARAEKLLDKKSSWYRLRAHRCLIDTPGFYEHRAIRGWKNKVPYFIQLASRKRLLIPGLYCYPDLPVSEIDRILEIKDKYMTTALNKIINLETGEITGTFVMITRKANEKMSWIHNDGPNKHRMPLLMPPEDAVKWIVPGLNDGEIQQLLDYEISSEALQAVPVGSIRTTKPREDGKKVYEAFKWPGLPPLGNDQPTQQSLF